MSEWYWNEEFKNYNIVCPYCGAEYEPTYEDTFIAENGGSVDCYEEEQQTCVCNCCKKKFTMRPTLEWRYTTETIDGQCTEEEYENGLM